MLCRKEPVLQNIEKAFPLYDYMLWKRDLLYTWKIQGDRSLSFLFATKVYQVLSKQFSDIPIVPVPPRPGKIRKNGWDQINELCTYLNRLYGVNVMKLLERVQQKEQKTLGRAARLNTLGLSYEMKWEKQRKVDIPEEVVIIDDIMTTGATLESCARALKSGGVQKIFAVTIFYV